MLNKKLIIIFLILFILFSCCISEKEKIKYVCCDGSIASDPKYCPAEEEPEKITVTKYNECEILTENLETNTSVTTTIQEKSIVTELGTTTTTIFECDTMVKFCSSENKCYQEFAYGICTPEEIERYLRERGLKGCKNDDDCSEEIKEKLGTTSTTLKTTTTSTTKILKTTTTTTSSTTTISTTTAIEESNACVELGCPEGTQFVGSSGGTKYHYCWCSYAGGIKKENLLCFTSKEDAQARSYTACTRCKPPS